MRRVDVEQRSIDWHNLRKGCVTGTTLKSAIGSAKVQQTLMNKIIAERMTELQIDDISSKHIDRGVDLEPMAKKAVIQNTGIEFIETGILESDDFDFFKVSPDAIYIEDDKIVGGLEIKCPASNTHVKYLRDNYVPEDYHCQVYAPFLMSDDVKWWLFVSYDDRNYEKPLFMYKAYRDYFGDPKSIKNDRNKLKDFLRSVASEHESLSF